MTDRFSPDFFRQPVVDIARALIGATLALDGVGGTIVETEAYDPEEPASHSFRGPTARNRAMFGPPGHAYVYLCYGVHWCLNVVCGEEGHGAAVLLRALAPERGLAQMQERRGQSGPAGLANGPGRLCQALGVTRGHDGLDLQSVPFELLPPKASPEIWVGPRIGITKAVELPWRFGLAGSPFLSRRF